MTKALITEINGFSGARLVEFLLPKGYQIPRIAYNLDNIENMIHIRDWLMLYICDIPDKDKLKKIIFQSKPDEIYHLAAIAHIPTSYREPKLTFEVNLYGSINLFEATEAVSRDAKVLYVGSVGKYSEAWVG